MNRKNVTRNALFTSIISLLLCVSMLVGTTFAWFTDEVTSGVNQIAAGNLDVELYHGKSATPTEKVDSTDKLFTDLEGKLIEHWEPGVVAYTNLQVANVGSLALKYQMALNFSNANYIQYEVDGKQYTLADVLQVALVENGFTGGRAAAQALFADNSGATIYSLESFALKGQLDPETKTKTYGIVVYWEPGDNATDNLYNLNNGKTTSDGEPLRIELGVNLFATQVEAESDSFGKDYDQVGTAVFTVAEANELLAKNEDVTLVNCIEPNGIIYIPANYNGTLVLDNVTIASVQESEPITTIAEGEEAVAPAVTPNNIVILGNVVVKATEVGMSAITGTKLNIAGNGHLTAVGKGKAAFGIGGMTTESITITDVTIDYVEGGEAYGVGTDTKYYKDAPEGGAAIGSGKDGADITLNNVDVVKAIGGSKAAAIGARYHTGVTVNITDSTIGYAEGGVSAAGIGGSRVSEDGPESGTTIHITNSTVTAKGGAYGAGIGSGYDTHCGGDDRIQPLCTINITDSIINATGGKYAAGVGTGYHNAALAGEIKNSTVNAKSGEKFYKASYSTAMDIGFGVVDPTREGVQDGYIIYNDMKLTYKNAPAGVTNSDELKAFIESAESGDTVLLLEGEYSLRFTNNTSFNADGLTFIGANETVKLSISSSEVWYGRVQGSNVTFENIHFTGNVGATGKATYNNCVFDNFAICASSNNEETYFNNCEIANLNTSSDFSSGNVYVKDSSVTKAEYSFRSADSVMNFENCEIGELISWNANTVLTNCTVTTLDTSHMTTATLTIDGEKVALSTTWENLDVVNGDVTRKNMIADDYTEILLKSGNLTLENVTFKNGLTLYTESGSTGTITLKNCTINLSNGVPENTSYNMCNADYGLYIGAISPNVKYVFENCKFTAADGHTYTNNDKGYNVYIGGNYSADSITFTGCTFEKSSKHGIGCSFGYIPNYENNVATYYNLTVTGCNFVDWNKGNYDGAAIRGNVPADVLTKYNKTITISGNTFGNSNGSAKANVAIDSWTGSWS